CASLHGKARRACEERCRGRNGCPAAIRTLAYVVTRCRQVGTDFVVGGQELQLRRGNCDPVTVLKISAPDAVPDPLHLCQLVADNRVGYESALGGVFQRLGVTPHGSGVVFEVSNQSQQLIKTPVARGRQGSFYFRRDGTGLRQFPGPPSRDPIYRVHPPGAATPDVDPAAVFQPASFGPNRLWVDVEPYLSFSPSGR